MFEEVLAANRAFYEAFESRDLDRMAEAWERSERIVCIHPGWPVLRGWDDVMRSWKGLFEGPQHLQFILTNEVASVQESIAWVTVDENLLDAGTGGTVAAVNMFAFDGTRWRMVVHHGSGIAV